MKRTKKPFRLVPTNLPQAGERRSVDILVDAGGEKLLVGRIAAQRTKHGHIALVLLATTSDERIKATLTQDRRQVECILEINCSHRCMVCERLMSEQEWKAGWRTHELCEKKQDAESPGYGRVVVQRGKATKPVRIKFPPPSVGEKTKKEKPHARRTRSR